MAEYVDEFRGTDDLYYAEVTNDDNVTGYVTSAVKRLAPVAEISKSTETSSDTKYYDNKAAITINAEGADTITLNIPALDLATLADITGKQIDASTGAFLDGEPTPKMFALGYRLGLTDGTYRYVWRYKGSFAIPDETAQTRDAGTDSNGQELTYTGISTIHKFTKALDAQGNPTSQKALVVDERDGLADLSNFFNQVTTCDTLVGTGSAAVITNVMSHVSNSNSNSNVGIGDAYTATLTAETGYTLGNVSVIMNGTNVTGSAYSNGAINISNVTGNIVIVATATETA